MKKNIFILGMISVVIITLSSCKPSNYFTSRTIDVTRSNIHVTPTVVDVNVNLDKKINFEREYKNKELGTLDIVLAAQNAAHYECINENQIDILVDPIYKIILKNKKTKVSLTGFAGYYKNPRTLNEDIDNLKNISMDNVKKYLMLHNPQQVIFKENIEINE